MMTVEWEVDKDSQEDSKKHLDERLEINCLVEDCEEHLNER